MPLFCPCRTSCYKRHMGTWLLSILLLMPSVQPSMQPSVSATAGTAETELGLRHRGVERLFAKFDREAKATARARG